MKSLCPLHIFSDSEQFLLVDVRERFEFDTYRAVYSSLLNIPFSEFDEELDALDKNQKTILICNNGVRSRTAARYLAERGFADVSYINGGLVKWQQNDLAIAGNPPNVLYHSLSLTKECTP